MMRIFSVKNIHWFIILILGVSPFKVKGQEKPNIIVVIIDDAGYADWGFQDVLGVTGSEVIQTPQIDQLKTEGVYFSQAYVTSSVCGPSRAGLITGRYGNRFGSEFNPTSNLAPGRTVDDIGLEPDELTIADHLKPLGYNTAAIGKWHLGETDAHHPNNRGFDYFYGLLSGSRPYFHTADLASDDVLMRNQVVDDLTEGYMTDVLTDDALVWMKDQSDIEKPFFTYLSYTAVHSPYQSKEEDFVLFNDCIGINGDPCIEDRQDYAAMTYSLDYNIGKLVDSLKSWDIYDNTLLFFFNDNGGKDAGTITNNRPLRGQKSDPYEGGLRVPFFMVWPGHLPLDTVYTRQVISLDIAATAIKAAGGNLPTEKPLDGVDLVAAASDTNIIAHKYLFWRKFYNYSVMKKEEHKILIDHHRSIDVSDNDTLYFVLKPDGSGEGGKWSDDRKNINNKDRDPVVDEIIHAYEQWESDLVLPYWLGGVLIRTACGDTAISDCQFINEAYGLTSTDKEACLPGNGKYGIFPNSLPSSQNMIIKLPDDTGALLNLWDISGRLCTEQQVYNNQNLSPAEVGLEQGLYIYRLTANLNKIPIFSDKLLVQ
ncbi:MAG: sulfatase-like hydrolase/transferase [Bacteroidota bacterium]